MTITLTKKFRLIYSPPAPSPGVTIRNCDWRKEQAGKTRISDLWYGYYQSDDLAEVEALVAKLGLVEADYCADWPNMSRAQRSQAMAVDTAKA